MKKKLKDLKNIKVLTKEEQMKIMGGMTWTGQGSKNVEDVRWLAMYNWDRNHATW